MKVNVHGKDVSISSQTITMIEEKLAFLNKYLLIDEDQVANAMVKKVGNRIRIEITILTKVGYLRAEVTDMSLRKAVDEAVERLEAQLNTQRNRLNRRHRDKLARSFLNEQQGETDPDDIPVRTKRVIAEEMDLDEAILRMEMLGHSFFIYRDEEAECLAVCYRRIDGGYGLIEIES